MTFCILGFGKVYNNIIVCTKNAGCFNKPEMANNFRIIAVRLLFQIAESLQIRQERIF